MKIPAAFAPQSWEMPPGFVVLEESASVVTREFDGEKLDWLVALVEIPVWNRSIMWMRPLNERFDAGYIFFDSASYQPKAISPEIEPFALRASLSTAWRNQLLGRNFCLNENGMLLGEDETAHDSILFAPDGKGGWQLPFAESGAAQRIAMFQWNKSLSEAEFCRLSSAELSNRLRECLSEPQNDISFARQFALMNEQERQELVFEKSAYPKEEFENLLRIVALRQDVWDDIHDIPDGADLRIDSSERSGHELYWDDGDGDDDEPVDESDEFFEDITLLRERFFPVNKELARHFCVRKWLQFYGPNYSITISRPTIDEQLEAQLHWRDWLDSMNQRENQKF